MTKTILHRRGMPDLPPPAGEIGCPRCGGAADAVWHGNLHERDYWLAECRCGLCFTWPLPTTDEIAGFYRGSYHASADDLEQKFRPKFERYVAFINSEIPPKGRALDVGATTGLLPALLNQRGFDAEGLEINPETARIGRERHGLPMTTGTFEGYAAPERSFDLITLCDMVEHTIDPPATLRKVNRLLRPGGTALVTFPDIRSWESRYWRAVARFFGRDWLWGNCHAPYHIWEFDKRTASLCFAEAGFSIIRFRRQSEGYESPQWMMKLLALPVRPIDWPWVARWLGSGMMFLLRKDREVDA